MAIECCICTEVLLKAETIVSSTPCGHLYHTHCLLEWIEKCENGANCPVCRQTFPQSEIVAVNAASDDEVEALAKDIAEKFTIKENNDGNRTVNSPIIVIPASLNYRIDTDSDDDFDYYDQDSGDERDDLSEIFRDYDDHLYDNDNFSNPGDFNDDIDDDLENDEAEEENIEVQSNGSMEDWDVESNGSTENSVENQDIGSNESAEDLNDTSIISNEHIQSEAESYEEQQSVDLNDNDSYGSGNDDNDEEINYQSDNNDDYEGINDDFDDADDYDYGNDDDDDDYNGNDDYDDYSD